MITIFRRIRKKLMQDDKAGKYLLYAFGEVFLVVIGILIALWVNNQNEEAKKSKQEKAILISLKEEYTENLNQLEYELKRMDTVIIALETLLSYTRRPPEKLTDDAFEEILAASFSNPDWTPSTIILEELKNSGGISQLSNVALRSTLFKWQRAYENLSEVEIKYNRYADLYIDYITQFGSVRNLDALLDGQENAGNFPLTASTIAKNSTSMLKDPFFENTLENFYFLSIRLRAEYKGMKTRIGDILGNT